MFIEKYLSEFNYQQLLEKYDYDFLDSLKEQDFLEIYSLFIKYNFYFVEDIIVNYYEIFMQDKDFVEKRILLLKDKLGENYNYIIGNDLTYLDWILEGDDGNETDSLYI